MCGLWTLSDGVTQKKLVLPAPLTPHHQTFSSSVSVSPHCQHFHLHACSVPTAHTLRAAPSQGGGFVTCPQQWPEVYTGYKQISKGPEDWLQAQNFKPSRVWHLTKENSNKMAEMIPGKLLAQKRCVCKAPVLPAL